MGVSPWQLWASEDSTHGPLSSNECGLTGRPKRLYVIVNPFGGEGAGMRVYTTVVEPLLNAAGISFIMQGVVHLYCFSFVQRFCKT